MQRVDTILKFQVYGVNCSWELLSIDYEPVSDEDIVVFIFLVDKAIKMMYYRIDTTGDNHYGTV